MTRTAEDAPDFTLDGLRRLLIDLHDAGFEFSSFDDEIRPTDPKVLLRHDIDVDVESAVVIAELEADLHVRSTFFFLVTSDLYNLESAVGRDALQQIMGLGHYIGLHFDGSLLGPVGASLSDRLHAEQAVLERLAGSPIRVFSLHKPGDTTELDASGHAIQSAYADRFFRDIGYVADSMGWWRFGPPAEQEFYARRRAGQVVIHPVWWSSERALHPADRLASLLDRRRQRDQAALAETIGPYEAWLNHRTTDRWTWSPNLRGAS